MSHVSLPVVAPPQMVSTAEPLRDKIVELAEKGVKARAIFDRLRLAGSHVLGELLGRARRVATVAQGARRPR